MLWLKYWREILILIATGVAVFLYLVPAPETITKVETQVVEKVVTKVVEKVKEIRPDGTVIEKVITKDETKDTKDKTKETAVASAKSKYEVAVSIRDLDYKDLVVGVGARLGNSPFWATAGYEVKGRSALVGIKVEF